MACLRPIAPTLRSEVLRAARVCRRMRCTVSRSCSNACSKSIRRTTSRSRWIARNAPRAMRNMSSTKPHERRCRRISHNNCPTFADFVRRCEFQFSRSPDTKPRKSFLGTREQILLSRHLVITDTKLPIPVEWTAFKVQPPDRAALMPLLKELEFTGLIKQYLPPDAGPFVEVVRTDLVPAVDDRVFFDIHEDRVSLWSGSGSISSVPLDRPVEAVFSHTRSPKVTYRLKTARLRLRGRGIELFPPYDYPLLMAYLLFPNPGKYELPDVVFEFTGQTVTEGDERTPWIERLFKEFSPRTAQEESRP